MSNQAPTVTNASAFRTRSLAKMVLFFIITLGIYSIYWMHQVNKQTAGGTNQDFSPGLRTIGLLIPIVNLYILWKFSKSSTAYVDMEAPILILLWIVFPPASWYLTSAGINEVAS